MKMQLVRCVLVLAALGFTGCAKDVYYIVAGDEEPRIQKPLGDVINSESPLDTIPTYYIGRHFDYELELLDLGKTFDGSNDLLNCVSSSTIQIKVIDDSGHWFLRTVERASSTGQIRKFLEVGVAMVKESKTLLSPQFTSEALQLKKQKKFQEFCGSKFIESHYRSGYYRHSLTLPREEPLEVDMHFPNSLTGRREFAKSLSQTLSQINDLPSWKVDFSPSLVEPKKPLSAMGYVESFIFIGIRFLEDLYSVDSNKTLPLFFDVRDYPVEVPEEPLEGLE